MLRNTLLQLRSNLGRVSAAGLAIVLGVGFVAASFVFAGTMQSSMQRLIAAPHLAADLVVQRTEYSGDEREEVLDNVRAVSGVATVAPRRSGHARMSGTKGPGFARLRQLPDHSQLRWYELAEGQWPRSTGEVAVNASSAESAGLKVGETVTLTIQRYLHDGQGKPKRKTVRHKVTITGFVDMGTTFFSGGAVPTVLAPPGLMRQLETSYYSFIDVVVKDGANSQQVLDRVRAAVGASYEVHTGQRQAEIAVEELGAGISTAISSALLPFAGIALFVAGFVIVNTFSILHAQRSRQYALLRCVGATRGQIWRSSLLEALIIGAVSSVLGVLLGVFATAVVGWPLGLTDSPVDFASLGISAWAVIVPVITGMLVTFLASLAPAGRAMRVAPLAALRPVPDEQTARKIGLIRLIFAVILSGIGFLMLLGGALSGTMLLAVPGAMLAALGVLLFTPTLIPATARLLGYLLRLLGPTGVLATGNAVRNPYRASSTSTALMIGVGLIVVLMTGTATVEATAQQQIAEEFPVDATLTSHRGELPSSVVDEVRELDATAAVAVVRSVKSSDGYQPGPEVVAVEQPKLVDVARHGGDALEPGTALVDPDYIKLKGWAAGQQVQLSVGNTKLSVRVVPSTITNGNTVAVSTSTLAKSGVDTVPTAVWSRAADGADLSEYVGDIRKLAAQSGAVPLDVGGAALMHSRVDMVLGVLLLVVTGLLGVAVIIAVVGIANTLGLSVLERGRESALLRALGLTRGQLRGTLAAEAVLLAVVGAALGAVLGVVFAWSGATALFNKVQVPMTLAVPWLELALILGCAVLAGVLASVLPARRAAKATPAAALADE